MIVCNHLGYNFAYWNFHERNLSLVNSRYFINNSYPLIFIHISGFDIDNPENLSKHQNRFNLENLKLISNIYREYVIALNNNNYDYYKSINSFYINKTNLFIKNCKLKLILTS